MPKVRHVRHTFAVTEKPFTCSKGCESAFARPSDLARHEKSHLSSHEREFKCDRHGCGFTANQRNGLICHIRSVHEKVRVYCNYPGCTRNFSDPSCLSRHRRKHGAWPTDMAIRKALQSNDAGRVMEPSMCQFRSARDTSEKLPCATVERVNPNISNKSHVLHTRSPLLQCAVLQTDCSSFGNSRPAIPVSAPALHKTQQRPSSSHLDTMLDTPCPESSSRQDHYNNVLGLVHPIQAPIELNFDTLVPGPSVTATPYQYQTNFDETLTPSFDPHSTITTSSSQPYNNRDSFGSLMQDILFTNDHLPEFGRQFHSRFDSIPQIAPMPETLIWPGFSSADATFPDISTPSSLASTPNLDFDFGCVDHWSAAWDITVPSLTWS